MPIDALDVAGLAAAFAACRDEAMRDRAYAVGAARETDGVELVARSFYRHLPVRAMRCAPRGRPPGHIYNTAPSASARPAPTSTTPATDFHPYRCVDWGAHPGHGPGQGAALS